MSKQRRSQYGIKRVKKAKPLSPALTETLRDAIHDYQNGRLIRAKAGCEKILRKSPKTIVALHYLALILQSEGESMQAVSLMQRAIAADPKEASSWSLFGALQQDTGEWSEAIKAYTRALDIDSGLINARHNLAWALLDNAQPDAAKVHFTLALKEQPDDAELRHGLALCLLEIDDLAGAKRELDRSLLLNPVSTLVWYDLGNWYRKSDDLSNAVASYQKALEFDSEHSDAHNNVGNCYLQMGEYQLARDHFQRSATLRPTAKAYMSLASVLGLLGEWDGQNLACDTALSLSPDDLQIHLLSGTLAFERDDFKKAELIFNQARALWDDNASILAALAKTLLQLGRVEEALQICEKAVALDQEYADAHLNLGVIQKFLAQHETAAISFEKAVSLDPNLIEAYNNLGITYADLGKFDQAYKCFERALSVDPDSVLILSSLLNSRKNTSDSKPVIDRLSTLAISPSSSLNAQITAHFALGKAYDDLQDYDKAFASYREGNRLKSEVASFDRRVFSGHVERIITVFNSTCFESLQGIGDTSELPVFVVGMPRSGTTLVESIIASHPQAAGAGELTDIYHLVRDFQQSIGTPQHYPEAVLNLRKSSALKFAASYLATLRSISGEALRIVDKMPNNFMHLGLIALLLPNAKIIHCRRSALDVCLSNYFQKYAYGHNFSYNFDDLACYYRQYQDLMTHWRQCLPISFFECDYEALVCDQETISREIINYCQLPWDAKCLSFHKTTRTVQTASHWQVRQPMYRSSSGRWRYYAPYIDTLRSALEREGCQL